MIEIRLLGAVEASRDGRPIDLGPRRSRFVLAVLALQPGHLVGTDRLIELCWPTDPPANPRAALQVTVSRLRAALGGHIEGSRFGYELRADRVDVTDFHDLVQQARDCPDDAGTVALLRRAESLWRGPPLADVADHDAAERLCGPLLSARNGAAEDWADAMLRLGRHGELVDELTGLVARDPARERLIRQLMLALYRSGQPDRALAVAGAFREQLAEQLGLDPTAEFERLHVAILRHDSSIAAPPAWDVPAQLPAPATGFTGRTGELRALDAAAGQPIILLTGTGGVGKTTLAVQWAHRIADRYPDGQLYVDLRGYSNAPARPPADVVAQFLRALGVPGDQISGDPDDLAALYRSRLAGRKVLLLLDNAGDSDQVRPLLPGSAGCLVLITSRDTLTGLRSAEGAHTVPLQVFTAAESRDLLATSLGADRVAAEPGAVNRLTELCAGLPLALRIAAAEITDSPSIAGYTSELAGSDRLSVLAVDGSTSVRATFEQSLQRLRAADQRLFRLLGVVPGADFGPALVAALADAPESDVRGGLRRLAGAHLVAADRDRYRLHDLIRLYAEEIVAADPERPDATERMYEWYVAHAVATGRLLYPQQTFQLPDAPPSTDVRFADRAEALAWLESELANMAAAIQHAGDRPAGWLIPIALRGYLTARCDHPTMRAFTSAGRAAARAAGNVAAESAIELARSAMSRWDSDHPTTLRRLGRAGDLARRAGWVTGEAAAASALGSYHASIGAQATALHRCRHALRLYEQIDDPAGIAVNSNNLGLLEYRAGHLVAAEAHFARAEPIYRSIGAHSGRARALAGLGQVHQESGKLDESAGLFRAARDLNHEVDNLAGELTATLHLAGLHRVRGELDDAQRLAEMCRDRWPDNSFVQADARLVIADVLRQRGDQDAALAAYEQAEGSARRCASDFALTQILIARGGSLRFAGRLSEARTTIDAALDLARTQEFRGCTAAALVEHAAIALADGDVTAAHRTAQDALDLAGRLGLRLCESQARLLVSATARKL